MPSQDILVEEANDIEMINRLNAPTIFIEGLSQLHFGYPTCRVTLHSNVKPKSATTKERREVCATLIIPTAVLVEMAQMILGVAKERYPALAEFKTVSDQALEMLITNIPETMTTGRLKLDQ